MQINAQEKTILIVDDEPMLREVLEFEMQDLGFKTLSAGSGRDAIEIVKEVPIHAVLSDIRMPKGNGIELLDAIKNYNIEAPVVVLMSGYTDLTLEDAYDKGAIAMFAKPLDLESLKKMLYDALMPRDLRWSQKENAYAHLQGKVELSFNGTGGGNCGEMVNIGQGGMFVKLDGNLSVKFNEDVRFKITFDCSEIAAIEGSGRVRWIRMQNQSNLPQGVGIEFKYLSEGCRAQVTSIIERKHVRSYIPKS